MYIKFSRVRAVTAPTRANWGDAIDFFIPDDFKETVLAPSTNILIPSGVKVEVPFGYGLILMNKSGIAAKRELLIGACLVDPGYSGEVHIDLHNVGNNPQRIVPGAKIAQATIIRLEVPSLIEVGEQELYKNIVNVGSRGEGGFGSTGT
jgi:dUTP pyrophosphatase